MSRFVVAPRFAWAEYPGLRPGRIYAGKPDVGRLPLGQTHFVDAADAAQTVCGLPRASFPHDFPDLVDLGTAEPCTTCLAAGAF
jgi:hypothetical protein